MHAQHDWIEQDAGRAGREIDSRVERWRGKASQEKSMFKKSRGLNFCVGDRQSSLSAALFDM